MPATLSQVAEGFHEKMPAPVLRRHVDRLWTNALREPVALDVVPDGCIDIYWTGASLQVAGPNTEVVTLTIPGAAEMAGVRFHPGIAGRWLGVPASELLNRHVPLADIWGCQEAEALTERAAGAATVGAVAEILEQCLLERLPNVAPSDPIAVATAAAIGRAGPGTRSVVNRLKAEFGWSERTLRRHCHEAFGYGPKTLERILRFQQFLRLLATDRAPLAVLAIEAGYADQAHLAREVRRLSGQSPSSLMAELRG